LEEQEVCYFLLLLSTAVTESVASKILVLMVLVARHLQLYFFLAVHREGLQVVLEV
tara:strand:- start:420 stop:587 length:168 start_codon:yes stop_codon:yes gene_type:complete